MRNNIRPKFPNGELVPNYLLMFPTIIFIMYVSDVNEIKRYWREIE